MLQIIIANCYLPLVRKSIEGSWLGSFLLMGVFSDLTPGWYATVGKSLIITQFVGIGTRSAETLFFVLRRKIKVRYLDSDKLFIPSAKRPKLYNLVF